MPEQSYSITKVKKTIMRKKSFVNDRKSKGIKEKFFFKISMYVCDATNSHWLI